MMVAGQAEGSNRTRSRSEGAAFVFGGSGGLGSAICRRLSGDFPAVFFSYRSNAAAAEALGAELAATCEADYAQVDVRDPATIEAALRRAEARFGTIAAVVFASGINIDQPFVSEITAAQWREVIECELLGFANVVAAVLPLFRARGRGALVNVGTFATRWYPPGDALSAVPKAGTEMLCRAVAREEGRYGIRANTVAPGIIEAGLGAKLIGNLFSDEVWEQQRKRVALRRFGRADDIADAVAFLTSDQSRYVTGVTLIVDGGLHL